MIKIENEAIRKQNNFWCQCVFHPTDAIEDPWGRRILDQMAEDGAINTVRMYSMFEDIVYIGADGKLCYDFRLSDLRLDYMVERGYDLLIAYAGIPDSIATDTKNVNVSAKNKTRYKGKLWNTAPPKDYALWEEICYEYTKHIVERYGIETVSRWRCQCFNEPDHTYLLSGLTGENAWEERLKVYCKLYEAFQRGIRRVSERIPVGGPALAVNRKFLGGLLDYIKEHQLKIDFVSTHYYGTTPKRLKEKTQPITVSSLLERHAGHLEVLRAHGFGHLPVLMDEWGMACAGFANKEDAPELMIREGEIFSAFYVRLVRSLLNLERRPEALMICLSGQHEMTEDFTGFRNFFTLNFIKKPIYNAHALAARLKETLLSAETETDDLSVIPTKDEAGDYAVLLSYANDRCEDTLPEREEQVVFAEDISDRTVTVYCIDKTHTNPYRTWERAGEPEMTEALLKELKEEGVLKPLRIQSGGEPITLSLTANATYLILVSN